MRDKKQDAIQMAIKRRDFLEKGYELFCARSIESVSMQDIADAAGYGVATLYRYFTTKSDFVIEVAISRWEKFREENLARRAEFSSDGMTGADLFTFYLDSFIELYRQHRDLLRFNQFFNIYIKSEDIPEESLHPYQELIRVIARQFHEIYEKAGQDHSMKTEFPEEEVFSTLQNVRDKSGLIIRNKVKPCKRIRIVLHSEYQFLHTFPVFFTHNSSTGHPYKTITEDLHDF